jgi:hypothetical protein
VALESRARRGREARPAVAEELAVAQRASQRDSAIWSRVVGRESAERVEKRVRRHGEPSVISVGTEHATQKFLAGTPSYVISARHNSQSPIAR